MPTKVTLSNFKRFHEAASHAERSTGAHDEERS